MMQDASSAGGGASRTFQSIFGSATAHHHEELDDAAMDVDGGDDIGDALMNRIRDIQKSERQEDDEDLWDDDFPSSDGNDNNNEADATTIAMERQAIFTDGYNTGGSARSMDDWADHDDEEETWKDALQSRVDQLELVVENKNDQRVHATSGTDTGVDAPPAPPVAGYIPPVDQRATLTLLPKTNLTRSISDPISAVEEKRASKLKAPTVARTASAVTATQTKPTTADASSKHGVEQRKRSNSRDLTARQPLTGDHKRLSKSSSATGANSVFVRAVVARGSNVVGLRNHETRVPDDSHVDKRSKSDERAATLALGDAEAVRRYILNDVKKMSVERIVSDAKRLHFLEDQYRRHPAPGTGSTGTTTSTTARHSSPTKKRAV